MLSEPQCARVLHERLLESVSLYGSEAVIWRGQERSRIRAVQMENFRGLLGIRRIDSVEFTDKRVVRSGMSCCR